MVFALPDRHFSQPSPSILGLNPTKHMKGIPAYQDSRIPYPGNKAKAVTSCGQSTAWKKCCLITPSHSVQAAGQSTCQLQTHFLCKDSIHLLRPCPRMAFPSAACRQKAQQTLFCELSPGQGEPGHRETAPRPPSAFISLALCPCPPPQ